MHYEQALADVVKVARDNAERVDADAAFPAQAVAELRAGGLLGLVLPEDAGGLGAGPVEFVDVVSELAAACGSTAMIYLMHATAAGHGRRGHAGRVTRIVGRPGQRPVAWHVGVQ